MVDYQYEQRFIDYLGRIISLAVYKKVNLEVITNRLENSEFLKEIENNNYSMIMNYTAEELFSMIYEIKDNDVNSYLNYDDAYWCGYVYANIYYEFNDTFPFIFLMMPLKDLLDKYNVYHEMDISAIYEVFVERSSEKTLLAKVLEKKKMNFYKIKCMQINIMKMK